MGDSRSMGLSVMSRVVFAVMFGSTVNSRTKTCRTKHPGIINSRYSYIPRGLVDMFSKRDFLGISFEILLISFEFPGDSDGVHLKSCGFHRIFIGNPSDFL